MSSIDKQTVLTAACGRWTDILTQLAGIPADRLDGNNCPCPDCDGTDRFNADRKTFNADGRVHCNQQCGISGDGLHVVQHVNGWSFPETLQKVAEHLGLIEKLTNGYAVTPKPPPTKPKSTASDGQTFSSAVSSVRASIRRRLPPGVTIADDPSVYRYNDATGSPVGVVLRWNRSDGDKEIRQVSTDGTGWKMSWKSATKPLWKLADITDAKTVWIVEGEKCVEAVESFGLKATTSAGGSGAPQKTDWSVLNGKRVVIIRDHDEPGRKYQDKVIGLIQRQAPSATVKVADLSECWPEIPEAGDAYDWSEAHDSKPPQWFCDELERIAKPAPLIENAPSDVPDKPDSAKPDNRRKHIPELKLTPSEDVMEERLQWLWEDRFLLGHVNIIAGDPGLGKSMIAIDAAARVSQGRNWPDGLPCQQGRVIYATTEDGYADTVKPRLSAANADHSNIVFLEGVVDAEGEGPMFLNEHLIMLDWHLDRCPDIRLIILDTLQSFIGERVNTNNNSSSRRVMTPLKRLAEKHRVAIVCIEHMTKSKTERGDNATYRIQGSIAFTGAARSVWICCKDPRDSQRRILQRSKTNLSADSIGRGLAFSITGPTGRPFIEWQDTEIDTPIDELLSGDSGESETGQATTMQKCCDFLRMHLTEAKPTNEVKAACRSELFSSATIRRAKDHLGIVSEQRDRKWFWVPSECMLAEQESDAHEVEHLSQIFMG